ncbi:hypothetical protein BH24GEM3_BH24GEM3_14580 [soil metagenome]
MARRNFRTVPEELIGPAELVAEHLSTHGYALRVEKPELGYPYTPTLVGKRQTTTIIVEVDSAIRLDRLSQWVAYGKSAGRDTRVIVAIPDSIEVPATLDTKLRGLGVGLWLVGADGPVERLNAQDLALNVQLPELRTLPRDVRRLLGPAYEKFARAVWREGFEEACQALEAEARRYLKAGLRSQRITIVSRKGRTPTGTEIDKMTLGQLGDMFARIRNQNHADAVLGQALKAVNKDRVGVVHHKARQRTENRLRKNVGRHMWSVVAALKEILG